MKTLLERLGAFALETPPFIVLWAACMLTVLLYLALERRHG
jgi:hypothetical protein